MATNSDIYTIGNGFGQYYGPSLSEIKEGIPGSRVKLELTITKPNTNGSWSEITTTLIPVVPGEIEVAVSVRVLDEEPEPEGGVPVEPLHCDCNLCRSADLAA